MLWNKIFDHNAIQISTHTHITPPINPYYRAGIICFCI